MAKYDTAARDKMAKSGAAMPDGSYPIDDAEDLGNAIHAVGRGGADHDAIRAHIIKRAKALGLSDQIPDNWNADGSLRSDLGLEVFTRERCWTATDLEVRSDGRTVYGLAVPFDQIATVNDGRGNYLEVFRRGSFAKTIEDGGQRVKLLVNHDHKRMPIGKATMLREDSSGLVGEFHVSATRDGDEALQLVRDGVLDSFSIGFRPVKSNRNRDGIVERHEVALRETSLLAFPAYAGAMVAGVRAMPSGYDSVPVAPLDSMQPMSMPASFAMPVMTGMVSHNGYGAFDMTLVTSNTNIDSTPGDEAAESTSSPRAADLSAEPVRHSSGPTPAEKRQWLLKIRGVTP